jgi:hypothetical protein
MNIEHWFENNDDRNKQNESDIIIAHRCLSRWKQKKRKILLNRGGADDREFLLISGNDLNRQFLSLSIK